jgi:hypothetical protein
MWGRLGRERGGRGAFGAERQRILNQRAEAIRLAQAEQHGQSGTSQSGINEEIQEALGITYNSFENVLNQTRECLHLEDDDYLGCELYKQVKAGLGDSSVQPRNSPTAQPGAAEEEGGATDIPPPENNVPMSQLDGVLQLATAGLTPQDSMLDGLTEEDKDLVSFLTGSK